ncbi:GntR family transcriptional regulator [Amycolatopsis rubida]|uniref:GntR family transcriptional regulator n=1 Tax=Amycolatopsis rubida TaxID=112413 RepID=A0ABX0C324_9PSEU|nr:MULTISPECIES: GntR family transcriptional regulator [Amycolatopsis]MYW97197.1 GntR family transcriptional regulator [Amycolatopsis rubida]NEC62182.1 GntR family transcriptional regulator [Amycolatopsis rubida]OAP24631.1 HTH-type transcriptional repressor YvoA [Amycolatopsis sp. M39]
MQAEHAVGAVPIHQRIADEIRDRIISGALPVGARLPSVRELQEQWSCTSITVRSALDVLRQEGRITGGRGKPATVRPPMQRHPIHLSNNWTNEQKALVLKPRQEREKRGAIEMVAGIPIDNIISTHKYATVDASDELAAEFSVAVGEKLQRRVYEMTDPKSGLRIAFSVSYIPLKLIEGNPELLDDKNEPWPGGHQHQLYTVGIELARIDRSIIAVAPTPGEREKWGMDLGTPIIRIRSRSVDTNDRTVELSDASYPADRTEIELSEHLTPWPEDYSRFDLTKGDR